VTEAKHKPPAVRAGAKRLVEILLAKPGIALADAAEQAGLSTRSAKTCLGRPNVTAHYRAEKQRLLEEVSLGNPTALVGVRDTSLNSMARVQAARTLEAMRGDAVAAGDGARRMTPGLVVQIINSVGEVTQTIGPPRPEALPEPAPMIEATPIEHDT
jgi:hypothetical protein